MKHNQNIMILNGNDIGISKIELNKGELYIVDETGKYSLCVHIYNWKDINSAEIGKRQNIEFNEYCFGENNESALIWPTKCYIEKPTEDSINFYLKFDDFSDICYMNKRNCFDIELKSLEVKVFIEYKDAIEDSIIYSLKEVIINERQ